ncbi:gamma-type small acid-soluble spore protein [Rummeliibacillus pycnus]|uniref:gamma-type small acid-soluble spore protein n=1 Tax=Rummeliibacillus pycnus TaxID=101070 RepID=UPI000C9BEC94|nr:gamma-type small acid-soluble spore protein [Rummeliibacillus pycnus]
MKKNFTNSKNASTEFGSETNIQEIAKQNQQAEKNKAQASGQFGQSAAEEFGSETNLNEVKKQNQQAEQNKAQASGKYAQQNQQNNF